MKNTTLQSIMVAMLAATAGLAPAQTFDSGSNGTNGALDVTNSITLDLPPNGVFHFTTVRIRSGQTLTFRTNALNTPVYLLAQSNVVIENNAYINVTGKDYSGIAPGPVGRWAGRFCGWICGPPNLFFGRWTGTWRWYEKQWLLRRICVSQRQQFKRLRQHSAGPPDRRFRRSRQSKRCRRWRWWRGCHPDCFEHRSEHQWRDHYCNGGASTYGGSGGAIRIVAPVVNGSQNNSISGGYNFDVRGGNVSGSGRVRIDTLNRLAWRGLNFGGAGKWTVGTQMFTGLNDPRRLDIVEAAGRTIALGSNPVSVTLGVGAPTNQVVRVRASGFTNDVPITVAVIPENGPSTRYDLLIPVSNGNPATNSVTVTLSVDVVSNIQVWTR